MPYKISYTPRNYTSPIAPITVSLQNALNPAWNGQLVSGALSPDIADGNEIVSIVPDYSTITSEQALKLTLSMYGQSSVIVSPSTDSSGNKVFTQADIQNAGWTYATITTQTITLYAEVEYVSLGSSSGGSSSGSVSLGSGSVSIGSGVSIGASVGSSVGASVGGGSAIQQLSATRAETGIFGSLTETELLEMRTNTVNQIKAVMSGELVISVTIAGKQVTKKLPELSELRELLAEINNQLKQIDPDAYGKKRRRFGFDHRRRRI